MRSYNSKLKILIFTLLFFTFHFSLFTFAVAQTSGGNIDQIKSQIERLEQEIQKLQKDQEQYKANISGAQAKSATLQNEISKLNNQIKYLENRIYVTSANINKTSIEITETEGVIFDTQGKIEAQKRSVAQILLFLARQDKESLLISLLKNNNISDFVRQVDYASSLNANLVSLILELKETRTQFESQKNNLESKKTELENLKQKQSYERSAVSQVKLETNSLLKSTKGKEVEFQKLLTKSEEFERQVNLEIFKLEDQLRRTIDPNSLPLARPGVLAWPVSGIISQRYGCIETRFARRSYSDCNNSRGGFHNGLDIAAPYGTPLRAAEDGKVVAIGNAPYAYGVWLAVEHSNGLVTAYTHMSVRSAGVGQQVKRGDVIGSMGSTGLSTGSHTHFMVYAPKTFTTQPSSISGSLPIGATLDPIDYL